MATTQHSLQAVLRIDAGADGVVTGDDPVRVIYGDPVATDFPEIATRCLSAVSVVGSEQDQVLVAERCNGLLLRLRRGAALAPAPSPP